MVKLPFKIKISSINYHENYFDAEIEFHDKSYRMTIKSTNDESTIKIPFELIGVKGQNVLVRISGTTGIYFEDRAKFDGKSSSLDITSFSICDDISNKYDMLDTLEIFFK